MKQYMPFRRVLLLLLLVWALPGWADMLDRPGVNDFIKEMVDKNGFDQDSLQKLFRQTNMRDDIITAITRPAESKPWYQYRPLFLTEKRINEGVAFWKENDATLRAAEQKYGVPAAIIVAIIGVETRYGRLQGHYRVIDALSTLAFGYPDRAPFFRDQLAQYLLMTREEKIDPLTLTGSYAGAMGWPQFMPSSFRNFAVDFDNDGHRDLWENRADIIGSVANYFTMHQWQNGEPVAFRAKTDGRPLGDLLAQGPLPTVAVKDLASHGITIDAKLPPEEKVALVQFDGEDGPHYWVTLNNFYVITRYNRSPLYAMAVYQLSEAIRATRDEATAAKVAP